MANTVHYRILNFAKYIKRIIYFIKKELQFSARLPFLKTLWLWKNGFLRKSYILYSIDSENLNNYVSDYNCIVKTPRINGIYKNVLINKLFFYQVLRPYRDWLTEIYCIVKNGSVVNIHDKVALLRFDDVLELCQNVGRLVVKPIMGVHGENVYILEAVNGAFWINRTQIKSSDAKHFLASRDDYFVCEYVQQHNYASNIFPDVANTIRILTMWDYEKNVPFIAAAAHRIGRVHTIPVDNWAKGGLYSSIDLETGILGKAVSYSGGAEVRRYGSHPDTRSKIEGIKVPRWEGVKTKLLEIASYLPYVPYVGWDVILTEERFKLLEGNPIPGLNIQMHTPFLKDQRVRDFYRRYNVI